MFSKKQAESNPAIGLAFLDILCCGLGAVVLLLLIVKHGQEPYEEPEVPSVSVVQQTQVVRTRLADLQQSSQKLQLEVSELQRLKTEKERELISLQADGSDQTVVKSILGVISELAQEDVRKRNLQAALNILERKKSSLPKPVEAIIQPTGGAVEGIDLTQTDKVLVLVDISASMLHRSLVDIIKLKSSQKEHQVAASKWRQTMNTARWAHGTISPGLRYKFVFFSEDTYDLEGNEIGANLVWDTKDSSNSDDVYKRLEAFVPMAGTNLESALSVSNLLTPRPSKVLIITDGLPNRITLPEHARGKALKGCNRKSMDPTGTTTAECRMSIAIASFHKHAVRLNGVPVDIVLLPLDGDSLSVRFYSLVASAANGRLLTPARDWLL